MKPFVMQPKPTFEQNRQLEREFMPLVLDAIKGRHVLRVADWEQDAHECSDLVVLRSGDIRIAVRVRRPEVFETKQYRDEITIRCRSKYGVVTEWHKIRNGWGDLMFYGFANPQYRLCPTLRRWTLVSLAVLRQIAETHKPDGPIPNHDGTAFYAINLLEWSAINAGLIVDRNWS